MMRILISSLNPYKNLNVVVVEMKITSLLVLSLKAIPNMQHPMSHLSLGATETMSEIFLNLNVSMEKIVSLSMESM